MHFCLSAPTFARTHADPSPKKPDPQLNPSGFRSLRSLAGAKVFWSSGVGVLAKERLERGKNKKIVLREKGRLIWALMELVCWIWLFGLVGLFGLEIGNLLQK
ncbi:hypothetical protein HAL011_11240 [Helicobacter ailurogastricus]|uniref:Uncharacterized protein n=1 Tax=Helicobacter ailurogastricus TaxID=1578720 RepID=A0A0K2X4N6_9HELI|nr:hypothetical protein HAL011_11240 [Helicobacter ailurogastricus]